MIAETLSIGSRAVCGAISWWLDELQGLIPDRMRRVWRQKRNPIVISYADGELRTQGPRGDERPLGTTVVSAHRRTQATLRLRPDHGLRTRLDVPIAAQDDLGRLLYFEMDRLTPFRPNEVYFAYRITGANQERRRLAVTVHVAPSRLVDEARDAALRFGFEVNRVELADADDGSDPALNLLPADLEKRGPIGRWNLMFALLAVVLVTSAIVIPLQRQESFATALEQKVAATKVKAERMLALREHLKAFTLRQNLVVGRKSKAPTVTRVIAELTHLIPDQAHVTQLHIRDHAIQVHGYAEAASELIRALARSDLLHEPQFRSPVTRDPRSELERFHISMHFSEGRE